MKIFSLASLGMTQSMLAFASLVLFQIASALAKPLLRKPLLRKRRPLPSRAPLHFPRNSLTNYLPQSPSILTRSLP
jgi:hypothetical protein